MPESSFKKIRIKKTQKKSLENEPCLLNFSNEGFFALKDFYQKISFHFLDLGSFADECDTF